MGRRREHKVSIVRQRSQAPSRRDYQRVCWTIPPQACSRAVLSVNGRGLGRLGVELCGSPGPVHISCSMAFLVLRRCVSIRAVSTPFSNMLDWLKQAMRCK